MVDSYSKQQDLTAMNAEEGRGRPKLRREADHEFRAPCTHKETKTLIFMHGKKAVKSVLSSHRWLHAMSCSKHDKGLSYLKISCSRLRRDSVYFTLLRVNYLQIPHGKGGKNWTGTRARLLRSTHQLPRSPDASSFRHTRMPN
jgi:hypothetical protein